MTTFVLVHGAMHGGWCWREVAKRLRAAGHVVSTPTLTGQGERAHLLTREITVDTHIQDIVNVVEYEDLEDLVLVFHSYSGGLAGPVVERLSHRVRAVVLAGAFYVNPGESNFDAQPGSSRDMFERSARERGDGWRIPFHEELLVRWGIADPVIVAELRRKLTDFSLVFSQGIVEYDPSVILRLPRTYIEHTNPGMEPLALSRDRAEVAGWTMRQIDTGHDMMLTDPDETTRLLLQAIT